MIDPHQLDTKTGEPGLLEKQVHDKLVPSSINKKSFTDIFLYLIVGLIHVRSQNVLQDAWPAKPYV